MLSETQSQFTAVAASSYQPKKSSNTGGGGWISQTMAEAAALIGSAHTMSRTHYPTAHQCHAETSRGNLPGNLPGVATPVPRRRCDQ